MVPMGDDVERALLVWQGEMNTKDRVITERFDKLEGRFDSLDEKVDGQSEDLTKLKLIIGAGAAVFSGVGTIVVLIIVAIGTKAIG